MKELRISVAVAASVAALAWAGQSRAEEPAAQTTSQTTTTTQPAPAQPAPAQPAPQAAPPAQPPQTIVVQQPPAQPTGTTTTTAAPYIPPGGEQYSERTVEKRPNGTLLSTGVGLFVVSYVPSIIAGAVSDRDADKNLFIPVVGPWLDLGDRGCDTRECGSREDINKAMIITSGVVQGAGVLLGIGSLIIPESSKVEERRGVAKAYKPEVRVSPLSFGAGAGVGAVGRF
jgi:hypothetical protein